MLELAQIWPSRKVTGGHDEPPSRLPAVRLHRAQEVRSEPLFDALFRWTRSCPRTGGALYAQTNIAFRRAAAQHNPCLPDEAAYGNRASFGPNSTLNAGVADYSWTVANGLSTRLANIPD